MNDTNSSNTLPALNAHEVFLKYDAALLRGKEGKYIRETPSGLADLDVTTFPDAFRVVVHSGGFHADELVAVALLEYVTGVKCFVNASRNPADWADGDFVIDVAEGLLDHHGQRFDKVSCGASRVYRLLEQTKALRDRFPQEWWDLCGEFIDAVARQDNGIEINPRFHFVSILSRIQTVTGDDKFYEALDMVRLYVTAQFDLFSEEVRARKIAEADIAAQEDTDIVVFGEGTRAVNVKEMLWERKHPAIFYVSPENPEDWRVLCCAKEKESDEEEFDQFSSKALFPEDLCGLRGEELSTKTGIPGGIFTHMKGFVGGFKTQEGAERFARLCIDRLT